jgi:hypothetical protein
MTSILKVVLKLLLALCFVAPCLAQSTTSVSENKQEEDEFRGILPEKFVKARPRKSGRAAPTSSSYKRVTSVGESKTSSSGTRPGRYERVFSQSEPKAGGAD